MTLTTRSMAPFTSISCAQINGISERPRVLAAVAGKVETKSGVAVNKIEIRSVLEIEAEWLRVWLSQS